MGFSLGQLEDSPRGTGIVVGGEKLQPGWGLKLGLSLAKIEKKKNKKIKKNKGFKEFDFFAYFS